MALRRHRPPAEQFVEEFEESLAPSFISVYDFVDWDRIDRETSDQDEHDFIQELDDIQSDAKDASEFTEKLSVLLLDLDWGNIRPALDTCFELVSVSKQSTKLVVAEGVYKKYDYQLEINSDNEDAAKEVVEILNDVGLYDIVSEIDDLKSYMKGVKVGFESDKRKNRQGTAFEDTVGIYLDKVESGLRSAGQNVTLKDQEDVYIGPNQDEKNEFDFVFFDEDDEPIVVFELNTYTTSGSKPTEVQKSYISAAEQSRAAGCEYVWVSDGEAWKGMTSALKLAYSGVTDLYNLEQLRNQFGNDFAAYLGVESQYQASQ